MRGCKIRLTVPPRRSIVSGAYKNHSLNPLVHPSTMQWSGGEERKINRIGTLPNERLFLSARLR